MSKELVAFLVDWAVFALMLEEAMEARDDPSCHKVCPDALNSLLVSVLRPERRAMLGEGIFEVFGYDEAFIERLAIYFQCGDQSTGIQT
jgi:hypothetical protein